MTTSADDEGTIVALLDRFRLQRLPQALALKEKVDGGGTLDDHDIAFLEQMFEDNRDVRPLLQRHPELESIAGKIAGLYKEITDKALSNEKSA